MIESGALSFQEFIVREPLPLANIHEAVFEFLRGRDDVVMFGAQAVNAYVDEPRMTQDVDLLSTRAKDLAEELRHWLADRFTIAVRVCVVGDERGFRLFQVRKTGNRHLVDVRSVTGLPNSGRIDDILVLSPPELIAAKVIAYHQRRGTPKAYSDLRDLAELLLRFPNLKMDQGPVRDALVRAGAAVGALEVWSDLVRQEITRSNSDDEF